MVTTMSTQPDHSFLTNNSTSLNLPTSTIHLNTTTTNNNTLINSQLLSSDVNNDSLNHQNERFSNHILDVNNSNNNRICNNNSFTAYKYPSQSIYTNNCQLLPVLNPQHQQQTTCSDQSELLIFVFIIKFDGLMNFLSAGEQFEDQKILDSCFNYFGTG